MGLREPNDIRAELVKLSRLLDPREDSSYTALDHKASKERRLGHMNDANAIEAKRDKAGGQILEALFHVAEEFFVDVHRIADALEKQNGEAMLRERVKAILPELESSEALTRVTALHKIRGLFS